MIEIIWPLSKSKRGGGAVALTKIQNRIISSCPDCSVGIVRLIPLSLSDSHVRLWHTNIKYSLWPTLSTSFMDLLRHTPPLVLSRPCGEPAEVADAQRERGRGQTFKSIIVWTFSVLISHDHLERRWSSSALRFFAWLPSVASQRQEKGKHTHTQTGMLPHM